MCNISLQSYKLVTFKKLQNYLEFFHYVSMYHWLIFVCILKSGQSFFLTFDIVTLSVLSVIPSTSHHHTSLMSSFFVMSLDLLKRKNSSICFSFFVISIKVFAWYISLVARSNFIVLCFIILVVVTHVFLLSRALILASSSSGRKGFDR